MKVHTIRKAEPADYETLGQVMFTAIRDGDSPYTQAQRAAWMPKPNAGPTWAHRLSQHHVWLAEQAHGAVGFMTLDSAGYIDLAYILPSARGQGVFGALLTEVEYCATQRRLTRLSTHASLMAEPAFAHYGFSVVKRETVTRASESLRRAEMKKVLLPAH